MSVVAFPFGGELPYLRPHLEEERLKIEKERVERLVVAAVRQSVRDEVEMLGLELGPDAIQAAESTISRIALANKVYGAMELSNLTRRHFMGAWEQANAGQEEEKRSA